MRNIPADIARCLSDGERFVYCFKFSNGERSLHLTSNDEPINLEDATYLPNSGLEVKMAIFNDSAQDLIEIAGIFEEGGITKFDDLGGYSAKIMIYFPAHKGLHHLVDYSASSFKFDDLRFTLILMPISAKLNQSLLFHFGNKCRANLGDSRCSVDLRAYPEHTDCDKSFRTCCIKFNNGVNFRGEPFIPNGSNFFE